MFSCDIEYISQNYSNSLGCPFIAEMGEKSIFFIPVECLKLKFICLDLSSNLLALIYFRLFFILQIDNIITGKEL